MGMYPQGYFYILGITVWTFHVYRIAREPNHNGHPMLLFVNTWHNVENHQLDSQMEMLADLSET